METRKPKGREAGPGNIIRYPTPVGEVTHISVKVKKNSDGEENSVCRDLYGPR